MQKKSTDVCILAELHPAPPSDAPLLDPETQHWLAGCWVASSESYWQNTCDWNKIIIITTTIKGESAVTGNRLSLIASFTLSLTARCMRGTRVLSVQSGSVGNCNNASLLLPSPLGLVTTVRHPLPSLPLSPLTLCSTAALCRIGRRDDTAVPWMPTECWLDCFLPGLGFSQLPPLSDPVSHFPLQRLSFEN